MEGGIRMTGFTRRFFIRPRNIFLRLYYAPLQQWRI